MTFTYANAVDEIYSQFYTKWLAEAPAIAGYLPEVRFRDDGTEGALPNRAKFWCRISVTTLIERQSTIGDNDGGENSQRWRTSGLTTVQLFVPKNGALAPIANQLGNIAKLAFRGKKTPGGVWFRNVTLVPLNPDEQWYRYNVVAEHQYDEQA